MKKIILFSIILLGIMAGPVWGQTVTENLAVMDTEMQQYIEMMTGRDVLANAYQVAKNHSEQVQELVDSGQFNEIPLNVRQALNRSWNALKTYIATIEADAEIMECVNFERNQ